MTAGDLELSTLSAVIDRRYSRIRGPTPNYCSFSRAAGAGLANFAASMPELDWISVNYVVV